MTTSEPNDHATPQDRRASTADLSWMVWTAIGIGGIWVAVLLISLFAPDLVSGSQQEHLPVAAFTTWFWGAIGTMILLWAMGRLQGSARWQPIWIGGTVALGRPTAGWNGDPAPESDRQGQLRKGSGHSSGRWLLDGQLVVSTANVLDEGVPGQDHPGAAILLEAAHWSQPRLQPAMVAFDPVVAIPIGAVPGGRHQLLQHRRVHRRLIGGDLDGHNLGHSDRPLKEAASCHDIPSPGDEDVDDLPELIDRAVHIAPLTRDLHIRLVHLPAATHGVPARPSGVDQQRREPLYPPVDRDVVDLDAALGEQLLKVAVRQAEAQVPADREHDHVGRKAEAGEGGPQRDRPVGAISSSHGESITDRTTSRPTQQRPGECGGMPVSNVALTTAKRL